MEDGMAKTKTEPWFYLNDYRGKDFAGEWPTFPEMLKIQTSRYPDRPYFVDFDGPNGSKNVLTYAQVFDKVQNLAKWMIANGLEKGDKVVVSGKNAPEWGVVYLAALYASGIIVPIDAALHEKEMLNLLEVAKPKFIFVDDEKIAYINEKYPDTPIFSLNSANAEKYVYNIKTDKEVEYNEPAKEDDTAAILFTSGTTGNPKGVMLSHKNFISDGFIAQKNFNHYPTDVFYALLPIHHAYTMQAAFINPMLTGASIVFGKSMAVTRLLKELREGKITVMLGVPLLYNKLLAGIRKGIKEKGAFVSGLLNGLCNFSYFLKRYLHINIGKLIFKPVLQKASIYTLRVAISGGGPLAASVFKQYNGMGIDFIQGYGLTETSPIITLNPVDKFKIHSVGQAFFPYMDVKIINKDEKSHRKVERQIGEIAVKGPMVMQGYYNMPEETAAMFTEDGYLKTGDLGWMDKDHYVMLCGRAKNLIVTSGGKNVYPEEIEDAFQLCDDIQQITVQGYIDNEETKSEAIEALIYPSDALYERLGLTRDTVAQEEVLKAIQLDVNKVNKTLQPYSIITKITILDEPLAMTTTQKVKRNYKK